MASNILDNINLKNKINQKKKKGREALISDKIIQAKESFFLGDDTLRRLLIP
jgi:hypothetical protein